MQLELRNAYGMHEYDRNRSLQQFPGTFRSQRELHEVPKLLSDWKPPRRAAAMFALGALVGCGRGGKSRVNARGLLFQAILALFTWTSLYVSVLAPDSFQPLSQGGFFPKLWAGVSICTSCGTLYVYRALDRAMRPTVALRMDNEIALLIGETEDGDETMQSKVASGHMVAILAGIDTEASYARTLRRWLVWGPRMLIGAVILTSLQAPFWAISSDFYGKKFKEDGTFIGVTWVFQYFVGIPALTSVTAYAFVTCGVANLATAAHLAKIPGLIKDSTVKDGDMESSNGATKLYSVILDTLGNVHSNITPTNSDGWNNIFVIYYVIGVCAGLGFLYGSVVPASAGTSANRTMFSTSTNSTVDKASKHQRDLLLATSFIFLLLSNYALLLPAKTSTACSKVRIHCLDPQHPLDLS
jgi:hypothetical protein